MDILLVAGLWLDGFALEILWARLLSVCSFHARRWMCTCDMRS